MFVFLQFHSENLVHVKNHTVLELERSYHKIVCIFSNIAYKFLHFLWMKILQDSFTFNTLVDKHYAFIQRRLKFRRGLLKEKRYINENINIKYVANMASTQANHIKVLFFKLYWWD